MKTKRKTPCKIKQRGGRSGRKNGSSCKKKSCRTKSCRNKSCGSSSYRKDQSGGGVCMTGLCAAGASSLGATKVGAALVSSFGSYKLLSSRSSGSSSKTKKRGSKKQIKRHQKFVYSDSDGKDINFEIKQNNKKITIKNGSKITHKTYKGVKSASSRYNKKIRECIKKGFDKC